jgi:hypothetical protein
VHVRVCVCVNTCVCVCVCVFVCVCARARALVHMFVAVGTEQPCAQLCNSPHLGRVWGK